VTGVSSPAPAAAVEIEGLTKSFGGHRALKDLSLAVAEGEFLSILGPNGAGKTTLLKIIAATLRPSSGIVRVSGLDMGRDSNEVRRLVGYVPHQTLLYDDLTAYENLRFYARMYGVPDSRHRIGALAERLALSSDLDRLVRNLSRGTQQRFSIARALLHDPSLLLLDEPETGLDQRARVLFREVLRDRRRTVIMSSHSLESCFELGDRVLILASGRIARDEPTKSLAAADLGDIYARCTEVP
jgi:heme exporter protein A